jgi:hypothetical protein
MNLQEISSLRLVQHFRSIGGVHIGARALHVLNCYGLAISLAYLSGEEGGNFLVQVISTCLRYKYRKGGGGRHPVSAVRRRREAGNPMCSMSPLSFIKIAENLMVFYISEMMGRQADLIAP